MTEDRYEVPTEARRGQRARVQRDAGRGLGAGVGTLRVAGLTHPSSRLTRKGGVRRTTGTRSAGLNTATGTQSTAVLTQPQAHAAPVLTQPQVHAAPVLPQPQAHRVQQHSPSHRHTEYSSLHSATGTLSTAVFTQPQAHTIRAFSHTQRIY